MAKKKTKRAKKSSQTKGKKRSGPGRPPGVKTFHPKGLTVRSSDTISRKNALKPLKGLRRITVEVDYTDEENGILLEALAKLVKKSDTRLLNLLKKTSKK